MVLVMHDLSTGMMASKEVTTYMVAAAAALIKQAHHRNKVVLMTDIEPGRREDRAAALTAEPRRRGERVHRICGQFRAVPT